jgi:archaetidylinositol phosphate synthase
MSTPVLAHPKTIDFVSASRINHSLTAACEQRALAWIAPRLPSWVTSDQLTALGLIAQCGAGASYVLARTHRHALLLVVLCLALNWFGDSLDGTLARIRQQQRPRYGFYVDHMVDVFGATALMGGLALSGLVHPAIAIAMLIAFLLLASESYLATYTLGRFHLSQGCFGPTEIRILLAVGTLCLLRSPYAHLFGHTFLLFDLGGLIATIAMLALTLILALRHTAQLFREEPLPWTHCCAGCDSTS